MIAAYLEPKGLDPDTPPLGAFFSAAAHRDNAERGSRLLRDAILRAKGHPIPEKPKPVKPKPPVLAIVPRHAPECCKLCGSPLRPEPRLISNIQAAVAAYYKLDPIVMRSQRRAFNIAHPRQVAMYLASELTPKSLVVIGKQFGGRDHTTVIHAIKAVKARMEADPEVALDVELLRMRLADLA